jgi:tripartite-type tricarboxylate transporter receptor subunit TctC
MTLILNQLFLCIHKKVFLLTLLPMQLFALAYSPYAAAQSPNAANYPNKQIQFIVPFPPGGPADVQARIVGQQLSARWKQPVIIDNRPGAGGSIGAEFVARAPADGYTFLYTTSGPISVNPIFSNSSFDPLKNLSSVILTSTLSSVMVVNPSLNIKSINELIQYAKDNPG